MKKLFKDWKLFEILLLIFSELTIIFSGIIFKSDFLTILTSFVGILCSLLQAKGKIISRFVAIAEMILYPILSYKNQYYGEVIIYILIVVPMNISAVISWIMNKNEENNTVKSNEISKKEWSILAFLSAVGFVGLYYLLKYFNTSQLIVSSLSMITSLIATYLIVRRSKYSFMFYIGNDIILILLWGIPILQGEISLIPVVIESIVLLVNDGYGWKNWNENI